MKKNHVLLLTLFTALYVVITLLTPIDPKSLAKYNLTLTQDRLLILTFLIPIVVIWAAAFYGFSKFKSYAEYIEERPDGKALNKLAFGLEVLAIAVVLPTIISSGLTYVSAKDPSLIPTAVIVRNYVSVAFNVSAFYLLFKGAQALAATVKTKYNGATPVWLLPFILISLVYTYVALTSPVKNIPATTDIKGLFYSPDWIILTTIVFPNVISWYLGLHAATLVNFYRKNVRGLIYQSALKKLSLGLSLIVVMNIVTQFFSLLLVAYFSKHGDFSLSALLSIIYIFIAVFAVGYLIIAQGAKALKKIETV